MDPHNGSNSHHQPAPSSPFSILVFPWIHCPDRKRAWDSKGLAAGLLLWELFKAREFLWNEYLMWRTWASPDEPKATLQRTTGVRCVDPCFKHTLPHPLITIPENTPDVSWWVTEWTVWIWSVACVSVWDFYLPLPAGFVFFNVRLVFLISGITFWYFPHLKSDSDLLTGS